MFIVAVIGSSNPLADFDGNGIITVSDVLYVVQRYGSSC